MDTAAQWTTTQDFGVAKSMAENISAPMNASATERKMRPQKDQAVNCPRCNSTNTKFCYYNNYSLTQPRYFCKTCRRYWTEGGTLRNVPVGGGSRKNKKSINVITTTSATTSSSSSSHINNKLQQLPHHLNPNSQLFPSHDHQNPKIHDQGRHDLNLNFHGPADYINQGIMIPQFIEFPKNDSTANAKDHMMNINPTSSALNFLSRINGARGLNNSFIPMAPNALENNALFAAASSSGMNFPIFLQECKPAASLGFSIDGSRFSSCPNNSVGHHQDQSSSVNNGSLIFTLGATKRSDDEDDQNQVVGNKGQQDQNSNGFWNGMLGGGNW